MELRSETLSRVPAVRIHNLVATYSLQEHIIRNLVAYNPHKHSLVAEIDRSLVDIAIFCECIGEDAGEGDAVQLED